MLSNLTRALLALALLLSANGCAMVGWAEKAAGVSDFATWPLGSYHDEVLSHCVLDEEGTLYGLQDGDLVAIDSGGGRRVIERGLDWGPGYAITPELLTWVEGDELHVQAREGGPAPEPVPAQSWAVLYATETWAALVSGDRVLVAHPDRIERVSWTPGSKAWAVIATGPDWLAFHLYEEGPTSQGRGPREVVGERIVILRGSGEVRELGLRRPPGSSLRALRRLGFTEEAIYLRDGQRVLTLELAHLTEQKRESVSLRLGPEDPATRDALFLRALGHDEGPAIRNRAQAVLSTRDALNPTLPAWQAQGQELAERQGESYSWGDQPLVVRGPGQRAVLVFNPGRISGRPFRDTPRAKRPLRVFDVVGGALVERPMGGAGAKVSAALNVTLRSLALPLSWASAPLWLPLWGLSGLASLPTG